MTKKPRKRTSPKQRSHEHHDGPSWPRRSQDFRKDEGDQQMKREIPNRRPCINTRTDNFHFSVSFDPHTGHPVEFFITGRGKVGQQLDTELYELSVKASKLMQGEFEDDLPRLREGSGGRASQPATSEDQDRPAVS